MKHRDRDAHDVRRIDELEDELKAANKRIAELKAERITKGN